MDRELELPATHADYLITVGYSQKDKYYYIKVFNKRLYEWNRRIYERMDSDTDPLALAQLYENLASPLLDDTRESRGPLSLQQTALLLQQIAVLDESSTRQIIELQETLQ